MTGGLLVLIGLGLLARRQQGSNSQSRTISTVLPPASESSPVVAVAEPERLQVVKQPALLASLRDEVLGRSQYPIDALEVTALLESFGITDDLAFRRYGADDVFALAVEVLAHVRAALAVGSA